MRTKRALSITTGTRVAIVNELRRGEKPPNIARRFHVSKTTVYAIAKAEGIRVRRWRRWTDADDEAIRTHYPAHGAVWDGWADMLPGRKVGDIHARASRLGVAYMGR